MLCQLCGQKGHEATVSRHVIDKDYHFDRSRELDVRAIETITMECPNRPVNWPLVERGMKKAPLERQ